MDSTETDNFIKIILLLQNVTDKLRILFKNKWIIKFNKEWKNSIDDGNILINDINKIIENIDNVQKENLKKGNIENWDLSTLLLVFREIKIYEEDNFVNYINNITKIRNKIAHHPSSKIKNKGFDYMSKIINNMLIFLDKENANDLRIIGNKYVKEEKYKQAINMYTEAIKISNISNEDLSKIYCNRLYCYYKQKLFEKALQDGYLSIELNTNWFNLIIELVKYIWK